MFGVPVFTFRPDAIGIFLSSFLLLLMYKSPEKVTLSAFISISLLHTKQILVVMALPIFIYYLFNNTKSAVKYFLACIIFTLAHLIILHFIFPLYYGASIYSLSRTIYGFKIKTALFNIAFFCFRYLGFLVVGLAGIIIVLRQQKGNLFIRVKNLFASLKHEYIILVILNIVSSLFFLLASFARNGGDGLKYCNDMLAPSVIIFAFIIWKYAAPQPSALRKSVLVFTISIAAFCSVMFGKFSYSIFRLEDVCTYAEIWETIRQYDNGSPIFLGMSANNYMLNDEKNYIYYDDGQIEYQVKEVNSSKMRGTLKNNTLNEFNKWVAEILYVDKIYSAGREYSDKIHSMLKAKQFSLVVLFDINRIINKEILSENYRAIKSAKSKFSSGQIFEMSFYVPR